MSLGLSPPSGRVGQGCSPSIKLFTGAPMDFYVSTLTDRTTFPPIQSNFLEIPPCPQPQNRFYLQSGMDMKERSTITGLQCSVYQSMSCKYSCSNLTHAGVENQLVASPGRPLMLKSKCNWRDGQFQTICVSFTPCPLACKTWLTPIQGSL